MQDIKNEFYKIFSNECDTAYSHKLSAAVRLFGGGNSSLYEVGLCLSFGSHSAYRKRADGRIVLARSDSDTVQSINISNINKFHGENWAYEILSAAQKLPITFGGFEMLIRCDCGLPDFSPKVLSGLKGICDMYGSVKPLEIINAASEKAYYLPSLTAAKVGITNLLSGKISLYSPSFCGQKIIAVITDKPKNVALLSRAFSLREDKRTVAAAHYLSKGNVRALAPLMSESSNDLLALWSCSRAEMLYNFAKDYTDAVKLLANRSGAVCFVKSSLVDEFVKIVGDRYEKKTGTRPAFYISD